MNWRQNSLAHQLLSVGVVMQLICITTPLQASEPIVLDKCGSNAVSFSKDGRFLATGGDKETITIWNLETKKRVREIPHDTDHDVATIALSPNASRVAATMFMQMNIWNANSGKMLYKGTPLEFTAASYSPDGKTLAASWGYSISFIDVKSGRKKGDLLVNRDEPASFVKYAAKRDLIVAITGRHASVWDARRRRRIGVAETTGDAISTAAISPDGRYLAYDSARTSITLIDLKSNKKQWTFDAPGDEESFLTCTFSADGKTVACGGFADIVRLLDRKTGKQVGKFEPDLGTVMAVEYSRDGKQLAAGFRSDKVLIWKLDADKSD